MIRLLCRHNSFKFKMCNFHHFPHTSFYKLTVNSRISSKQENPIFVYVEFSICYIFFSQNSTDKPVRVCGMSFSLAITGETHSTRKWERDWHDSRHHPVHGATAHRFHFAIVVATSQIVFTSSSLAELKRILSNYIK